MPVNLHEAIEPLLNLFAATLIGCIIGVNRDLHGKPIGLRTLGLVGCGACTLTLLVAHVSRGTGNTGVDAASRVIQGVVTGIGFLGAGVILRENDGVHVRGLTTAATIWVTAALGIACGLGAWQISLSATFIVLLLLIVGGPLERAIHKRYGHEVKRDRGGPPA